jgi:beta-glucosidase
MKSRLMVFLLGCISWAHAESNSLPRSTPEAEGLSSQAIVDFVAATDKIDTVDSFMIVRHGKVIAEGWWKPNAADKAHIMNSVSKSFTGTGVGLAIHQQKLKLDDKVLKFFPADTPADPSDNLKAMRVRDLLTMTGGDAVEPSRDGGPSVKQFLAQPVVYPPGTHFLYNTIGSYVLSAIITKVTGQTALEYLEPRLFEPLGIENPHWDNSPEGNSLGGYGLYLRTEDMAKLGQLYLQKGKWNGKQLVPRKWFEQATAKQIDNENEDHAKIGPDWTEGYGFQFWRCRHNAYRADGAGGQFIVMMPDQDVVVAITADRANMQAELDAIWNHLLPAFRPRPLPADPAAQEKVKQAVANLVAHHQESETNNLFCSWEESMLKQHFFVPSSRRSVITALPVLSLAILQTWMHPDTLTAQSALADNPRVPYSLPVVLPAAKSSPPEDSAAPYTPTVVSLIKQLEPHNPPTITELTDASRLLSTQGGTYEHPEGSNPTCHNLANVNVNVTTNPRIMPLCFSDGLGVNVDSGPNIGKTTGLPSMLTLASSFDRQLANAMGQVEGREGRNLMVTGLLGPQADTDVFINWGRGHHTPGEDPFLNGIISAAQINGIQGQGLMSQVKHYAVYYGAGGGFTDVQDQALHEMFLTPYEIALKEGGASSIMCSYQKFRDASPYLDKDMDSLIQPSPFAGGSSKTWPLNEVHFACENPLLLNYVLRNLWGSKVFVASDYGAVHSANGFLEGDDHEDPSETYFDGLNPEGVEGNNDLGIDSTSSTCTDATGRKVACGERGVLHVAGIPGPGCSTTGCSVANAVANGTIPLSVFNQALARILYQEERFGLLGCDNTTANCKNPGGIGSDRTGLTPLADGPVSGSPELGTKNGDAAISEKAAEEGAILLKNDKHALPITDDDLKGGIAVSGPGAEYLVANPNNEGAAGFVDRNAINPLQQLQVLSGVPSAFTYTPANVPTGQPVPCNLLSSLPSSAAQPPDIPGKTCDTPSGLQRSSGSAIGSLLNESIDKTVDYSSLSPAGQLAGGKLYRWDGWIYVPVKDAYVFRVQHSTALSDAKVSFTLDNSRKTLIDARSFYQGQYYGSMDVVVSPTNAGYLEMGLRNRQCALPQQRRGRVPQPIVSCSEYPSVGWHRVTLTVDSTGLPANSKISLRFATSRVDGDIDDAAAAAESKALAVVFVDDQGRNTVPDKPAISSLGPTDVRLIKAVAAKNPNTVVVLNTGTPAVVKEWIDDPNVKAVLNMWHSGQEGGTATARLLLGQANPSGHVTVTWPRENTDTIATYNQPRGLYPGDMAGIHLERVNGDGDNPSVETQGIYSGYRYYDNLGLPVQFPFGFGLSYTLFQFSALTLRPKEDDTVAVTFSVRNSGSVAGAAVPQVYVGPGPAVDGVQQALRSLRGFDRVYLEPGESKQMTIELDRRSFQYWSEPKQRWVTNYGNRTIYVGDADEPSFLPLSAAFKLAEKP